MSKVLYECNKCGKTFISNGHRDGLNCDECKGSLTPLGYVDEFQNSIDAMKDKIENSDKQYMLNKKSKVKDLTIKINLDIKDFENKLNRIEKKLEGLNRLEIIRNLNKIKPISVKDVLEFEETLNKVKELVVNDHTDMSKDTLK